MIHLPKKFKENIIIRYGENGIKWLKTIDKLIEKYVKRFNLYDIKLVNKLSMNIVLAAVSDKYGEVVIKIGTPGETTVNEIKYMRLCNRKCFAKCYYSNLRDRVMILEKVSPGYGLNEIKDNADRIMIFCNIFDNIKTPISSNNSFKTLESEIRAKINLVYDSKGDYSNILFMVKIVEEFYNQIKNLNLSQYLLHDDLKHSNILKSNDGWKIIDPHGIIGEKVFDMTQFIRFELNYTSLDELDNIITAISKELKEDKILIYKALYINTFLKIVYYIKTKYNNDVVSKDIEICKKILENIYK